MIIFSGLLRRLDHASAVTRRAQTRSVRETFGYMAVRVCVDRIRVQPTARPAYPSLILSMSAPISCSLCSTFDRYRCFRV